MQAWGAWIRPGLDGRVHAEGAAAAAALVLYVLFIRASLLEVFFFMKPLVQVDGEALIKAILNSDFRNIPVAGAYLRKRPTPQCFTVIKAPIRYITLKKITKLLACFLTGHARAEKLYPQTQCPSSCSECAVTVSLGTAGG